jgi:hypothetical protein
MKVVAILLMSLSLALAVEIPVGGDGLGNVTQCIYRPETKILSCRGLTGDIECPAICESKGNHGYRVFGLGFVPELVDAKPELVRYWLYPRSLDNVTYVNHTIFIDGVDRDVFLYYGDKFQEYGLRVTDSVCWQRIVGLIKVSSTGVQSLIGEVLVYDREVSKRWLWGYGWGLGLNRWGYGGLGYPYTIYGR